MSGVDPLLRRSLTFFRRGPAWSLAVALAVAAFAAARATAPLVTDAAADRSFVAEVDAASTSASAGHGLDARAYTTGLADLPTEQAVAEVLDDLPVYDSPLVTISPLLPYSGHDHPTPVIRTADGRRATAIVFSIGDASTSLQPSSGPAPTNDTRGIWVPDTLAASLGIAAGDDVIVGLEYRIPGTKPEKAVDAPTTVAGIYATDDGVPVSAEFDWRATGSPLPRDPSDRERAVPLLLTDNGTAMTLIAAMNDSPFVKWDLRWGGPVTLEQGRDVDFVFKRTAAELLDTGSIVGRKVSDAHAQRVVLSSGVHSFVERSEQAAATLQPVLVSIALTAQVMSAMVLAICIWMLTRARRREHALSMSMGANPLRLGLFAAIEQLVPVIAGVATAYVVVRWYPGLVAGKGSIDQDTLRRGTRAVLWAFPIAIGAIAVAGFAAVWPLDAASEGRAKRVAGAIRAETILVVAAVATGAQILTQKGSVLNSGSALLFPLLAVLAGSVVVVRVGAAIVRVVSHRRIRRVGKASRIRRPRSLATWMARRRVSHSLTELSALVIVVAAGVGLFVYCTSISADGRRSVLDKAAAVGGARATAAIDSVQDVPLGHDGFPSDRHDGSTVVWTVSDVQMAPNVVADILVVDPVTFQAAAAWRDSFAGRPLHSLLEDIGDSPPFTVDVVVAGNYTDTFPNDGTMGVGGGGPNNFPIRYHVVARIPAAPWQRERSSLVMVAERAIAQVSRTIATRRGESVVLLAPVSAELRAGTLVAISGPSGSGKTTLCNIIIGWEHSDTGSVTWGDDDAQNWAKLAVAPQRLALLPSLDIRENLALPFWSSGLDLPASDLMELAERLEIDTLLDRRPSEISFGEQQRAAIARALLGRPSLAVLDEPTGHQDEVRAGLVLDAMLAARTLGTCVVVATHDADIVDAADEQLPLHAS